MSSKLLQYTDNDLDFLLLNIIGHDPIHDFGDPTPLRWGGIVSTIREFDTAFDEPIYWIGGKKNSFNQKANISVNKFSKTVGGAETTFSSTMPSIPFYSTNILDTPQNINILKNRQKDFKRGINTDISRNIRQKEYINKRKTIRLDRFNKNRPIDDNEPEISIFGIHIDYKNNSYLNSLINDYIRSLSNHLVLYTFFDIYTHKMKFNYDMNTIDLFVLIRNSSNIYGRENIEYIKFFEYIAYLFLYFIFMDDSENRIKLSDDGNRSEPIEHPIDYISYFFKIYEDEINTLFYLFASTENIVQGKGGKTKKIKGGNIDFDKMNGLVQNLQTLINREDFVNILNKMEELSHNDFVSDDDKIKNLNQYNTLSENIRTNLIDIYSQYNSEHLYKKFFKIRELSIKPFSRKFSIKSAILTLIDESLKTPKKIIASVNAVKNKEVAIKIAEERAAASGTLSPTDKTIFIKGFVAMIATFALTLCGYDINSVPDTGSSILNHQINILKYQIGGKKLVSRDMTDSLDDELMDFYKKTPYYINNIVDQKTKCSFKNYLSNNAAAVGNMINKTLCNQAARIDGMPNYCARKSAIEYGTESGNVNFTLTNLNNSFGYNGILTSEIRDNSDFDFNINLEINISLPKGKIMGKKMNIPVNKPDTFVAVNALGNSVKTILFNVIPFLISIGVTNVNDIWRAIIQNMYSEIHDPLIDTSIDQNITLYNIILRELLFKGTGDFFQEINAVCKNGGYVNTPIYSNNVDNSIKYKGGDAVRYFAANDRPSAIRFMHMLINGSPQQINLKAFGGYVSKNDEIIVKRSENKAICNSGSLTGGKNKRTLKRKNTKL
jgi:hypothetical protein